MNRYYARVAQRVQRRCEYCRAPEDVFNFHFEVDHISPVALGGTNALTNLALACPACNLYKPNAVVGYDTDMQTDVSLYHPRRDTWSDHFYVDAQSNRIEGCRQQGAQLSRSYKSTIRYKSRLVACGSRCDFSPDAFFNLKS